MSILEYLYSKYGEAAVNGVLNILNNGDRNYKTFLQYINLSDECIDNNISCYKTLKISELNTKLNNRYLLYNIVNVLSHADFTFKRYNTCITYGTFDLFHTGHLKLLQRIKELCNNLIVGVSTDEFNNEKGKQCVIPYSERANIVSAIKYVTKVIPETSWDQKSTDIKKYNADCFIMGDDWTGKFDFLKPLCDVIYLPRTPNISTTTLKQTIAKQ